MIAVMLAAIFVGFPISFTLIFLGFVFGAWGFGGKLVFYLRDYSLIRSCWSKRWRQSPYLSLWAF